MTHSEHKIVFQDARNLGFIPSESIALIVTSPPYPMIAMWDDLFASLNDDIGTALDGSEGRKAFELMHLELDKVWKEAFRVSINGGWTCINIGDATRSVGNRFRLYSNHARILESCFQLGFDILPIILWRKQTNAPNKFMGSGMLPAGAYVTLEHEYILLLRKNGKRSFETPDQRLNRQQSAFFWEERNLWFSDVWDFKGVRQDLNHKEVRNRSAAFPFELAYRLINMYSARGDTILDPFLGTGTSMLAAAASCRHSIGVEISRQFQDVIQQQAARAVPVLNSYLENRLKQHMEFVNRYRQNKGPLKHRNNNYSFPVMTAQESELKINYIDTIDMLDETTFRAEYVDIPTLQRPGVDQLDLFI